METYGRRLLLEHWEHVCGYLCDGQGLDDIAVCGRLSLALRLLHEIGVHERQFFGRLQQMDVQDELDREVMLEGAVFDSDFEDDHDAISLGFSVDSDGNWTEHEAETRWRNWLDTYNALSSDEE